ncbi:oxidoreductase [Sphingomonas sp.]|uniref:oxidoreductase n=1 Tax=Sphingomonas sp. TaxID=28214 RepID=UPI003BAD1A54
MTVNVGLIGYGLGGRVFHAPLIAAVEDLRLKAIASSRRDAVLSRYPHVSVTDADCIINDPAIDLVVISTPNETHFPLAQAALAAGKHVVIDKPITTTLGEAAALAGLAESRRRHIFPFHNRRWDGDFLTVRHLIDSGTLGAVHLFEGCWDRFRPVPQARWREGDGAGAGLLADLGPHLIDQALALFGTPRSIAADVSVWRQGAIADDHFDLTLFYPSCRVRLSASLLVAAPRPRFAVHGSKGSFVKRGLDPQEAWLASGGQPGTSKESEADFGSLTGEEGVSIVPTLTGDYREFYAGVADTLTTDSAPPVPLAAALTTLNLIELARQSSACGQRLTVAADHTESKATR